MRVMQLGEDQEDDRGKDGLTILNRHVRTLSMRNLTILYYCYQ